MRKSLFLISLLLITPALAFDTTKASRYPSPDMYRPNVDGIIVRGTDSTGEVSKFSAKPPGGSSTITLQEMLSSRMGCVPLDPYGGVGDNQTDNSAALASLVAALPATGGCVQLGAGTYKFLQPYEQTFPASRYSLSFRGTGPDSTRVVFPSGNGFKFNFHSPFNSVHMSGLAILTGAASPATSAVALTQTSALGNFTTSTFRNVNFSGTDGGCLTQFWGNAIDNNGVSGINYADVTAWGANNPPGTDATSHNFIGNGIVIRGDAAHVIVQNISGSNLFCLDKGVVFKNESEGLTVTTSNFTNGNYGVWTEGYINQLTVNSSQFNVLKDQIHTQDNADITAIQNNVFILLAGSSGFVGGNATQLDISHNSFTGVGANTNGVIIQNSKSVGAGTISGNQFIGTVTAINLTSSSKNITSSGNSFANVGNKIFDQGAGNTSIVETAGIAQYIGDVAVGKRFFGLPQTPPSVSACGSPNGTLSVGASDLSGSITLNSATPTCNLNFSGPRANPADCTVTSRNGKPPNYTTQVGALLIATINPAAGDVLSYMCPGQ